MTPKRFIQYGFLVWLLVGLMVWSGGQYTAVEAATLIVLNTNDSGAGSLRAQIAAAAASGDIIQFDASLSGQTITLASELVINKNLTIQGNVPIAISGNNATRVFDITGGTVVLDRLIIRNGLITPEELAVIPNENGANIRNAGNLTIRNSAILNGNVNGGDFFQDEGFGGGISTSDGSTLNVINTTIANNVADEGGGGIAVPTGMTASVTIANSTIIGNNERSGFDGGGLSIPVSIAPPSGQYPVVKNSIIANNTSTGFGLRNSFQDVTSQGYNISDDDLATTTPAAGDQFNTSPGLSALNGNGVAIPTNSSAAIDRGNPAGCTDHASVAISTDQRGNGRNDLRCDVGAAEFVFADGDTVIKSVAIGATESFGPTLVQINRTAGGNDPGAITIRKVPSAPNIQEAGEMPLQWEINPAGSSTGLTINLSLCYTPGELAAAPGVVPGNLEQYRWVTNGSPWTLIGADSRPAAANYTCIVKNGVSQLSWWTIASVAPTAVSLQQVSSPALSTNLWLVLAMGLLILLTTSWLLWRRKTA